MSLTQKFKYKYRFQERKNECINILSKYPDRIPVICEKNTSMQNKNLESIDKIKYLVPADLTVGQFIFVIRKRIKLTPEQALFLYVGRNIPSSAEIMSSLYEKYKDPDGFLYIEYSGENTFG
jgi:GABA(A) receptor-associated protein